MVAKPIVLIVPSIRKNTRRKTLTTTMMNILTPLFSRAKESRKAVATIAFIVTISPVWATYFRYSTATIQYRIHSENLKKFRKKLMKSNKSKFFFVKLHFWQFSQFKN